jgi:predicted O-methyltransferase YrrM
VPERYFKDGEGRWFMAACDFAIAFPVLDQTRRWKFVPKNAYRYRLTNPASHHNVHGTVGGTPGAASSASSALQVANAEAVLAKPPLACRRPLSGSPAALDQALQTAWRDLKGRLARVERGVELLAQVRARLPVELLAAQALSVEEGVPLHWLSGAGGWSADLELLHHLRGVLDRYQAPSVLEFGSGAGSRILARLCANRGGRLVSVEHDPVWLERSRQALVDAELAGHATVRLAPLVDADFLGLSTRFYDMAWLDPSDRFDVVLVDGPPSRYGRLVRVSGLPAVAANLSPDFRLFLDDYEREDEQKVAEIWRKVAPDLRYRTLEFQKAVCEVSAR